MSDIATKFIFVFDCFQDMDIFYQLGKFVHTSYSDFALYFMVPLPAEYTAVDYMAYLNRKYAKYLNMSDSDFKIDELKVNSKILYTPREIEVKIKRKIKDIPTQFTLLIGSIHDRKVIEGSQFVSSALFYYDHNPENPNGLCFVESLPDNFNSLDYIDFIKKNFSEYLVDFDFKIEDFSYSPNRRMVKVKVERKETLEKYKDVKVILELPDGKAAIEFGEIGKKEIQHFNNDVKLYSYWFTLKVLGGGGKGPIYSYLYEIFGDLIKEKYYLNNTEIIFGDCETYRFEFERRNEMKNMFFDNFTEPAFADYEPIIGRIITKGEPEITLIDFHLEYSAERYPFVQMDFNISPGVITEDKRFSIKRYLDNNAVYGIPPRCSGHNLLNEVKETLKGGYKKKPPFNFKLYSGVERSTQRYKTICHWEDGEKTTIYRDKPVNGGPVTRAFAWCYIKRTFGTVSHFKKHVDKRTTKIGGIIYFEGDCIQDEYAQASVGQDWIQYDIYDAAALAITAKRYGGLKKLNDDYILKAIDIDADLRDKIVEISVASVNKSLSLTEAMEKLDKEKKTKKSNK